VAVTPSRESFLFSFYISARQILLWGEYFLKKVKEEKTAECRMVFCYFVSTAFSKETERQWGKRERESGNRKKYGWTRCTALRGLILYQL